MAVKLKASETTQRFPLGAKAEEEAHKALKSLIAHELKSKGSSHQYIYLVINTEKPLTRERDFVPRIIPVPNRMAKASESTILLVTKDPSTPYRDGLTRKGSPTEDMFKDIMPLKKLRTHAKSTKTLKKLYHEYDYVVADHRIHHLLPDVLGEVFYKGHKRIPFMLQLAKPDLSIPIKKKQDRVETVDPKYVRDQVRSICKNTFYIPAKDDTITVKIGYTDSNVTEIVQNMASVIEFLQNPKFKPAGGVLKHNNQIRGLFVKTNESMSLPVYRKSTEEKKGYLSDDE